MSEETIGYLKQVIPFKDLSEESLRAISQDVSHVEFPEGLVIIREGDEGDSLYIIKSGTVQVYINGPEKDEKIILTKLSEGDYFGEMSLITGEPRSATVETTSNVSLLRLDKDGFQRLISNNPKVSLSLSHMLSQRLKQANIKRAETEKFYHAKITQSGSLSEISFYELLRFCEQNALTGRVKVENAENVAELSFLKGIVQSVELGNLTEDQSMDTLMQWREGTFVIEPSFFTQDESIVTNPEHENGEIGETEKITDHQDRPETVSESRDEPEKPEVSYESADFTHDESAITNPEQENGEIGVTEEITDHQDGSETDTGSTDEPEKPEVSSESADFTHDESAITKPEQENGEIGETEEISDHQDRPETVSESTDEPEKPEVGSESAEWAQSSDKSAAVEEATVSQTETLTTQEIVEKLLNDTLRRLISIVGSQLLRENLVASQEQLVPFFPTLESLKASFSPEFRVELSLDGQWTEKQTLAIAVFLQSVLKRCSTLVIGMCYLDIREIAGSHAAHLDRISFFDYITHAGELAQLR